MSSPHLSMRPRYVFALFGSLWLCLLLSCAPSSSHREGEKGMDWPEGKANWPAGKERHKQFSDDRSMLDSTEHFRVIRHGAVDAAQAKHYLQAAEGNFREIKQWLGKTQELQRPFTYHFHASTEEKGLLLKDTRQSHVDFGEKAVHTVLNPAFEGNRLGKENKLLLRHLLGKPAFEAFEDGLWGKFAPSWQKEGPAYWMYGLVQSELAFPLKKLLDNKEYRKSSPLTRVAAAYTLVKFLAEYWGKAPFLKRYSGWKPSEEELAQLQPAWEEYLQQLPAPQPKTSTTQNTSTYYRGFNFAHEGYSIYNGYGSKLARQSLDRLEGIHTNAIALVPYSYMGDPKKPTPLKYMDWAGGETDESLVRSAYDARKRGMRVLLKPQIWFGKNSWPGEVAMKTEEDWRAFFQYYGEWIRHYALLAEIHELDMLCLGVEFAQATLARPDDWRRLAENVRKVYRGKLTYAANWGQEIEQFAFWDAFDYVGVNCYYPLSKQEEVSDRALAEGFRETVEHLDTLLSSHQKPILFTEIGFRSVEKPWRNPHAAASGRGVRGEAQARCYRAVIQVLEETQFGQGVFWWKWPSNLEYAAKNPDSFAPNGQPAEQVVADWFSESSFLRK